MRNYIRQKAGEIEVFKALEVGSLKWCKEHVPRDGDDWTEEGQMLLDDPELWLDHPTFLWECHASRKRDRTTDRTTEDGTLLLHKKGAITATERYLTSGSLHRTRQDKGSHMLTVITVKLPFITQFHPHHLLNHTGSFPQDSQKPQGLV